MDHTEFVAIAERRMAKVIESAFAPVRTDLNAITRRVDEQIASLTARVEAAAADAEDELDANEED